MSASWLLSAAELRSARAELIEHGDCCQPGAKPEKWATDRGSNPLHLQPEVAAAACRKCPVRGTCLMVALTDGEEEPSTISGGMWGYQIAKLRKAIARAEQVLPALHAAQRAAVNGLFLQRRSAGLTAHRAFLSALLDPRFRPLENEKADEQDAA